MVKSEFSKKEAKYYYECVVYGNEPIEFMVSELAVPEMVVRKAIISHALKKIKRRCTVWWWVWKAMLAVQLGILGLVGYSLYRCEASMKVQVGTYFLCILVSFFPWMLALAVVGDTRNVVKEARESLRDASEKDMRARLQAFERDSAPHYWLDFNKWNT